MKKRCFALFFVVFCSCFIMAGCQKIGGSDKNTTNKNATKNTKQETNKKTSSGIVELKVWADTEDREIVNQICEKFAGEHKTEANFKFVVQPVSADKCRSKLLNNILNASDIYTTTDDELLTIVAGGAASEITESGFKADDSELSVKAATIKNKIYGYPLLQNSGSVLFYNKKFLNESDIKTVDGILRGVKKKGKKFAMDWSLGSSLYSFYGQTGLKVGLQADGTTTSCSWNSKDNAIKGTDVAKALMDIANNRGFLYTADITNIAKNGNVAAFAGDFSLVNQVRSIWGNNLGVAVLPTYTCGGKQVQMSSFTGYDLLCVNPYSKNLEWAHKLAGYISNEENQLLLYGKRGRMPSNVNAAKSDSVQSSEIMQAVSKQESYSELQRVGVNFKNTVPSFGKMLAGGSTGGKELQDVLDGFVADVTAKVK